MDPTTSTGANDGRGTLVGRYALKGLVGQGGMADVELAQDMVLDRQIAVKILHARYADDPSFLARFRREAQAAASLNHPNIVAVYDTGEEDGRPFIVMEYVAGQSLRELLRREQVLPARAAEMVSDAALGLHYAHERGLVHRDVKPANILLTDDGQVKVADFGIARAVSSQSVTQTAAVFGTAAYVAPEQAQGENVDRRTDIYALGCVLYELLTGRQPFAADSAVALAYKHVSEPPTPPSRINPDISPQLESVVLKAMAKTPVDRYQTARDLSIDLSRAVQGMAVNAPPAAAYATTRLAPPVTDATMVQPSAAPTRREFFEETYEEEPPPRRSGSRAGPWVLGLLILAILAVTGYLLISLTGGEEQPVTSALPDVTGLQVEEAEQELRDAGFVPAQRVAENSAEAVDEVLRTDPAAGTPLAPNAEVTLFVSGGPETVALPSVDGRPAAEARAALEGAGFAVNPDVPEANNDVEEGLVIRSEPGGNSQVAPDATVTLFVSTGPAPLEVPNVVGLSSDAAVEELRSFCDDPPCLSANIRSEFSNEVAEGQVLAQDPTPGTQVAPGQVVTVVVSDGPEPVPSPSPTPTETEEPSPSPTPTEPSPSPTPTASPSASESESEG